MNRLIICVLLLPLSVSCQTKKAQKSRQSPLQGGTPMSCHIEGRIVRVLPPDETEKGSLCAQYSCKAQVQIISVASCGSATFMRLNAGDTVAIRFAYTLHATGKLFPGMKAKYPGLKKGSVFYANAEQRMAMGTDGELVVTAYSRK